MLYERLRQNFVDVEVPMTIHINQNDFIVDGGSFDNSSTKASMRGL